MVIFTLVEEYAFAACVREKNNFNFNLFLGAVETLKLLLLNRLHNNAL